MAQEIQASGYALLTADCRKPVEVGDVVHDMKGEKHIVRGGIPPESQNHVGRVRVDDGAIVYPQSLDIMWVPIVEIL